MADTQTDEIGATLATPTFGPKKLCKSFVFGQICNSHMFIDLKQQHSDHKKFSS